MLLYLLPFVFTVHNVEEVLSMEKWTRSNKTPLFKPVSTLQFGIAVSIFSLLGFLLIFGKPMFPSERIYLEISIGFSGMLLLNVFFPHLLASINFRKYAPGVITALIINLPFSLLVLIEIYATRLFSFNQMILLILTGGVIGIICAYLFLKFGKYIETKIKT